MQLCPAASVVPEQPSDPIKKSVAASPVTENVPTRVAEAELLVSVKLWGAEVVLTTSWPKLRIPAESDKSGNAVISTPAVPKFGLGEEAYSANAQNVVPSGSSAMPL